MDKLTGFKELKRSKLPSVNWFEFTPDVDLDQDILWTLRTTVEKENSIDLPKLVGLSARQLMEEGLKVLDKINGKGIAIYYPYFLALKSGTIEVHKYFVVIEGVYGDLWNIAVNKEVTYVISYIDENDITIRGKYSFFDKTELEQLKGYAKLIKKEFDDKIKFESSILAEWSYASSTNRYKMAVGAPYFIFHGLKCLE